ncbi:hypothetical protein ACRQ5D_16410 [Mucilaginibacter sp. P25]|uniref:hypothetical protein n=1 Tax=unclassified Mucilaginibacter TaxID=2617802 RepID=UPI003D670116
MKNRLILSLWIVIMVCTLFIPAMAQTSSKQRYKVAVVDLMILKRQKLGAFQLAKEIGADGVEVDMGGLVIAKLLITSWLMIQSEKCF